MPAPTERIQFTARIDKPLHERLVEWTTDLDRPLNWGLNEAVKHYLDHGLGEPEEPNYDVLIVKASDIQPEDWVRVEGDQWIVARKDVSYPQGEEPHPQVITFGLESPGGQTGITVMRRYDETMYQIIFRSERAELAAHERGDGWRGIPITNFEEANVGGPSGGLGDGRVAPDGTLFGKRPKPFRYDPDDEATRRILREGGRVQTGETSFLEMPKQSEAEKAHFDLLMQVGHGDPTVNGPARDKLLGKLQTETVRSDQLAVADLVWIEGADGAPGAARRVDFIDRRPEGLCITLTQRGMLGGEQAFEQKVTVPLNSTWERVVTEERLDWAVATDARKWPDRHMKSYDDVRGDRVRGSFEDLGGDHSDIEGLLG
jgi:hypothetical protein